MREKSEKTTKRVFQSRKRRPAKARGAEVGYWAHAHKIVSSLLTRGAHIA